MRGMATFASMIFIFTDQKQQRGPISGPAAAGKYKKHGFVLSIEDGQPQEKDDKAMKVRQMH